MARHLYRFRGTHLNVGTSAITTIQLPTARADGRAAKSWLLVGFHYKRSGGTAATYAPTLGQVNAWVAGGIEERMTYTATAVATAINDVFSAPIPCRTDLNGRLFFRPGFNTGTDNDGDFEFWFEAVKG